MAAEPFIPPTFDSLVLAAVAREIGQRLGGARVSGVLQPDAATVGLRLRTRGGTAGLICSIHPRWARCVIASLPDGRSHQAFALQLRARLAGARLRAVAVEPFERVLVLTWETLEGDLRLILELMGRHSNLLLVQEERIAGALKTVTPAMSRVRPVAAGQPYVRPPRDRPTPAEVDPAALRRWLAEGRPLTETLVSRLLGLSRPLAAHLALAAGLPPQQPAPPQAAEVLLGRLLDLADLALTGAFSPVWYADGTGRPVAYAAIPLLTYRELTPHPVGSMSAAVVRVVEEQARAAVLGEHRRALLGRIADRLGRTERAAAQVESHLTEAAEADRWRRFGQLLLAYASTVPPGATAVTVPDFDGKPVTIPLDPQRSPVANAQACFRRHARDAASRRILPERLAALRQERAYLEQMRTLAELATTQEEIRTLAHELEEAGVLRQPADRRKRSAERALPRTFITATGLRILVGRSGRENDYVTFTLARADDLWLHARGMPGAHVVLKTHGRTPSPADVETAAEVAAYFSQGRDAARVPVDVVLRRHVRKMKGARPGMVTYRQEQTLMVAPRLPQPAAVSAGQQEGPGA
ncbi:MAG: NFACT family protein [Armatimonadota bacterium]|nr:NFACT family protein [Armatimonadota bacterium]MDR7464188.1 NFACT family protein [Armatimonadota bacterium]MDR7475701.1 NFACT family protein [Armatimonadota bacterium]MDR7538826.1 NFACT family protein [Armatimonadota bacterium]